MNYELAKNIANMIDRDYFRYQEGPRIVNDDINLDHCFMAEIEDKAVDIYMRHISDDEAADMFSPGSLVYDALKCKNGRKEISFEMFLYLIDGELWDQVINELFYMDERMEDNRCFLRLVQ